MERGGAAAELGFEDPGSKNVRIYMFGVVEGCKAKIENGLREREVGRLRESKRIHIYIYIYINVFKAGPSNLNPDPAAALDASDVYERLMHASDACEWF